ncbi:hypothetical protein BD779DRAFT_628057 [Infundibulicybe gibba]|nr:hypothetical protein BD779DRAFT_628057 [Infundibulicybe gibba]
MPGLLSLANELILSIADELDTRKIFRGTCRQINAVVSPRVFSYITIDIHEERLDVGISQLEALATRSTCTAEYVRTIDIRRLAPNYGPNMGYTFVNGKFVVDEDPKDPKTNWAQEKMRELLPGALSALKGATTAIWKACDRDPDWVSVLVSEFLGTLPALDSLHLIAPCEQFVPHLNRLRISSLTKLVVSSGPDAAIAKIIANNPCLTHLDVLVFRTFGSGDITTLHSLLEDVPLGQPLRLEHLRIGGCHIRFDHEILPHLRHLRSLKLSYLNFGPPRDLWRTVWRARIPLEAVTALVNDDLIDYLASVTGIKKIGLLGANTDVLANRFFTKVVPRHSKTLVSLSICLSSEAMVLRKHNASILIECTQLSRLTIAIDTSPMGKGRRSWTIS